MKEEEGAFMPSESPGVTAVILAAARARGSSAHAEHPKPMLDIKGKSILERQIEVLNACGVKDVAVVRGYKKEAIKLPNVRYYDNDEYATTNEVASLLRAGKELGGPFLFLYGDILFERGHLEKLLKSPADVSILVDRSFAETAAGRRRPRAARSVVAEDAQEAGYRFVGAETPHQVARVGRTVPAKQAHGEFVGMAMLTQKGARALTDCYHQLAETRADGGFHEAASLRVATFPDLLQELVDRGAVCRRSTSTRAGSRSTPSRTIGAPGR
jgi:phosphoenolpyruvate phosphomutase